jgi:hypothetical protein
VKHLAVHLVLGDAIVMIHEQNRHRRWVIVMAVFAVAALLLLLGVFLSHDREQSIPKSLVIHGR